MAEIEGQSGELIERYVALLREHDVAGDVDSWLNVGAMVAFWLGIEMPDDGKVATRGSLLEKTREEGQTLIGEQWFSRLRRRLESLVKNGLDEGFVIRAVIEASTRWIEGFGDAAGSDERRREFHDKLLRDSHDPAALAEYRLRWSKDDPEVAAWDDTKLAFRMRDLAESPFLAQTSIEELAGRWAALERWNSRLEEHLPASIYDEWLLLRARRGRPT